MSIEFHLLRINKPKTNNLLVCHVTKHSLIAFIFLVIPKIFIKIITIKKIIIATTNISIDIVNINAITTIEN